MKNAINNKLNENFERERYGPGSFTVRDGILSFNNLSFIVFYY